MSEHSSQIEKLQNSALSSRIEAVYSVDFSPINQALMHQLIHAIEVRNYMRFEQLLDELVSEYGYESSLAHLQVVYRYRFTDSEWAKFQDAIFHAFEIEGLEGLDCDWFEVLRLLRKKSTNWKEGREAIIDILLPELEKHLEFNDVFLFDITVIRQTRLAKALPKFLDLLLTPLEGTRIGIGKDDLYDISELFMHPTAFRILITSGYGSKVTRYEIERIIETFHDIGLISKNDIDCFTVEMGYSHAFDYSTTFLKFKPRKRELLISLLQALDADFTVVRRGLNEIERNSHSVWLGVLDNVSKRDDPEIQEIIAEKLGDLHISGAEETLLRLFDSDKSKVRQKAIVSLGKIGSNTTLSNAEKMLGGGTEDEVVAALTALCHLGTDEAVRIVLSKERSGDRIFSLFSHILGLTHSTLVIPTLLDRLIADRLTFSRSGNPLLSTLMQFVTREEEKNMLKKMVNHFRENTTDALAKLGSISVEPLLHFISILLRKQLPGISDTYLKKQLAGNIEQMFERRDISTADKDGAIKAATRALGLTFSPLAVDALSLLAETGSLEIRRYAIEALGEIDLPALEALIKIDVSDEPTLIMSKIGMIGQFAHPKADEAIILWTKAERVLERSLAYIWLICRKDPAMISHIQPALDDESPVVRIASGRTMITYRIPEYEPLIEQLKSDKSSKVINAIRTYEGEACLPSQDFWV
ncbi:MAG: hypothetical protein BAJATHORv1_30318 [Candidatus Thorarchaeota archaeon]|nr:MAG: hypothetical protein BAJATHORv1_30318 [Candidatus Thorarchaeota archaeon]